MLARCVSRSARTLTAAVRPAAVRPSLSPPTLSPSTSLSRSPLLALSASRFGCTTTSVLLTPQRARGLQLYTWGTRPGIFWRMFQLLRGRKGYWMLPFFENSAPKKVPLPPGETGVINVSMGVRHSAFVTDDHNLYVWGTMCGPELGLGKGITSAPNPMKVPLENVASVSCGQYHTIAVNRSGEVFTWGRGKSGCLGHGDNADCDKPTKVKFFEGIPCIQTAAGADFSLVLTATGRVYCFGRGEGGELGDDKKKSSNLPVRAKVARVVQIGAGPETPFALDAYGRTFAWGSTFWAKRPPFRASNTDYSAKRNRYVPTSITTGLAIQMAGKSISTMHSGQQQQEEVEEDPDSFSNPGTTAFSNKLSRFPCLSFDAGDDRVVAVHDRKFVNDKKELQLYLPTWQDGAVTTIDVSDRMNHMMLGDHGYFAKLNPVQVASSFKSSAALDAHGSVFTWGNRSGAQGRSYRKPFKNPQPLEEFGPWGTIGRAVNIVGGMRGMAAMVQERPEGYKGPITVQDIRDLMKQQELAAKQKEQAALDAQKKKEALKQMEEADKETEKETEKVEEEETEKDSEKEKEKAAA